MSVVNEISQQDNNAYVSLTWTPQTSDEVTPSSYFRFKGALDRVLAVALLLPGLPIIAFLVTLVRLTSKGPGIYRQTRVGKDGRIFKMYKIRTMRVDAEARSGAVWTQVNDPRITRLGRVLRKLHLDEFPQLFNVLRGEMSLIGPRPERPVFVQSLTKEIPGYLDRIKVCPGITGLAQINLPPDTDLNSVRRKLILDVEYIREAGLSIDIRMFLCTCIRLIGFNGELAMSLMGLRREIPHLAGDDQTDDDQTDDARSDEDPTERPVGSLSLAASRNTQGPTVGRGKSSPLPGHHASRRTKASVRTKPR